ncbi:MAG: 50S ribosomal protein L20 [bacterium]
MPRVKGGTTRIKKRKKVLKMTKGYKWGRKKLIKLAKTAINKAGQHAYADRKKKKGDFRSLWQIRINNAVRELGMNYSTFIAGLKKANIEIDRKALSDLAINNPEVFKKIVEEMKTQ